VTYFAFCVYKWSSISKAYKLLLNIPLAFVLVAGSYNGTSWNYSRPHPENGSATSEDIDIVNEDVNVSVKGQDDLNPVLRPLPSMSSTLP